MDGWALFEIQCHQIFIQLELGIAIYSFKAESAKAISSYKWIKNNIIYKKIDLTQIALFDQLYIYHKICYKF